MGFLSLLLVASTPVLQVILMGLLGAFLASGYSNTLHAIARRNMNKVVFTVFTPSLMFASLSKTVTFEEIVSWWFMPVNVGLTFLIGGILGWIAVKILRPPRHLEGLVIATSSSGNLGNLLLIIVPAVCGEQGNPFGDESICRSIGLSYVSFSMALGGLYIWTYTYSLMRNAGKIYHANQEEIVDGLIGTNMNSDATLVDEEVSYAAQESVLPISVKGEQEGGEEEESLETSLLSIGDLHDKKVTFWGNIKETLHKMIEELIAPPTVAAIIGFIVGAVPWLKSLFIGSSAPLKVVQDSIKLLGDGTVPCITLILGGNLTQGLRKSKIKPVVILAIVCIRYVILPLSGIAMVKAAHELGFISSDPLFRYILMIQFTVPPAMNIGTMAELFDVGREECSVIFLWTYVVAAVALTFWSTVYLWILS